MKTIKYFLLTAFFALCGSGFVQAQAQEQAQRAKFKNQYAVGVAFVPEWKSEEKNAMVRLGGAHFDYKAFTPSFGITAEGRFDTYNGVELGVFYRELRYRVRSVFWGQQPYVPTFTDYKADYLSLRLGYKFYSKIVNAGVAFNTDIWVGGTNKMEEQMVRYGIYISVSKDIPLYKGLILEPEVHYNPFWANVNSRGYNRPENMSYNGYYVGAGVKLKYQF